MYNQLVALAMAKEGQAGDAQARCLAIEGDHMMWLRCRVDCREGLPRTPQRGLLFTSAKPKRLTRHVVCVWPSAHRVTTIDLTSEVRRDTHTDHHACTSDHMAHIIHPCSHLQLPKHPLVNSPAAGCCLTLYYQRCIKCRHAPFDCIMSPLRRRMKHSQ